VERSAPTDGYRIALVGCGYWGSKHVRVLHSTERVAEVVLVDSQEDRLQKLARSYKTAHCYATLQSALPHVDAVVVATPPSTHVPVALAAIRAGKHVLVEKPLAPTSRGARALISAATDQGVVLMVGHTFEYNPAVRKLRDLAQSEELGALYYIDSARLNLGLYQNDVNVIFDLAPHDVSIINYVLGRKPIAAAAWACRHAHQQLEDVAYLRLFYDESFADRGLSANIHVSWLDPCKVRRVTAVGSKKMAVYDDLAADERIRVMDKGVCSPPAGDDLTQPPMSYRYGDIVVPFVSPEEPLSVQDRHFIDCIDSGAHPLTGGENGLAVVEALEAADISRRLGRPVLLDEVGSDERLARLSGRYNGHDGSRLRVPRDPNSVAAAGRSLLRSETR
jgi:predicted dehydrogenase